MTTASAETSLSQPLAEQAAAVANEMNISSERLIALAVEGFIERYHRNRQLMEQLRQAEENDPDEVERQWLSSAQESYRQLQMEAEFEQENPDRLSNEEFETLLDQLLELTDRAIPPGTPPLSDYALSRESFYEGHPKL